MEEFAELVKSETPVFVEFFASWCPHCRKVTKSDLKPGDLVFFNTSKRKKGINHVGVFLKNHYFIHASTSKGVIISSLHENYYRKHWKKGGRVKK